MSKYPSKLPKPPLLPTLPTEAELALAELRLRQTEESERMRMNANKITCKPRRKR